MSSSDHDLVGVRIIPFSSIYGRFTFYSQVKTKPLLTVSFLGLCPNDPIGLGFWSLDMPMLVHTRLLNGPLIIWCLELGSILENSHFLLALRIKSGKDSPSL
jgi:hypothetical protein